ncbi:MAG: hypothetical protein AABX82_03990 [Nanoarchaeota archaeon]
MARTTVTARDIKTLNILLYGVQPTLYYENSTIYDKQKAVILSRENNAWRLSNESLSSQLYHEGTFFSPKVAGPGQLCFLEDRLDGDVNSVFLGALVLRYWQDRGYPKFHSVGQITSVLANPDAVLTQINNLGFSYERADLRLASYCLEKEW